MPPNNVIRASTATATEAQAQLSALRSLGWGQLFKPWVRPADLIKEIDGRPARRHRWLATGLQLRAHRAAAWTVVTGYEASGWITTIHRWANLSVVG